jgi:hypothetical protein
MKTGKVDWEEEEVIECGVPDHVDINAVLVCQSCRPPRHCSFDNQPVPSRAASLTFAFVVKQAVEAFL